MQDTTATAPTEDHIRARAALELVLRPDDTFDLKKLGKIEHKVRSRQVLSACERGAYDAVLADPLGAQILTAAAAAYDQHLQQRARKDGGTVEAATLSSSDVTRWREEREAREEPHDVEHLEQDIFTSRIRGVEVVRFTQAARKRGHSARAPREAKNTRRRGSRRGERATSSSSDDPEPEPPGARLCECGCGAELTKLGKNRDARYATKTCAKRGQRRQDREQPDRVVERTAAPTAGRVRCDCGAKSGAYEFDHQWICVACGRPIAGLYSDVNGRLADPEVLAVLREEVRRGGRVLPASREWRTRPSRSEAAKLSKTRNTRRDPEVGP